MGKVFVSGVFDMLHSGHVEFLRIAAERGEVYVSVGSDRTVYELKGRAPVYSEKERLFLVQGLKYVKRAFIGSGSGMLDFEEELKSVRPDVFLVNRDGDAPEKRALCRRLGIRYEVLERSAARGLPQRSTTQIRARSPMPYRLDLAGGWLDQPWVSKMAAGPVITVSIEATHEFFSRSGMATSTRERALRLWGASLPLGEPKELAKILFAFENWPDREFVSGSQDALGIVLPGVNRLFFSGRYWPHQIDSCLRESVLTWLEEHIRLVPLFPRPKEFSVLSEMKVERKSVCALSRAAEECWEAVVGMDLAKCAAAISGSFEAQTSMFPKMLNERIQSAISAFRNRSHAVKLSGAGGGGYLILLTSEPGNETMPVRIRRR